MARSYDSDIRRACEWFNNATESQKLKAVRALFEHAIESEWVGVWSEKDAADLAQEAGKPIESYLVPYFRTCGDPIA